MQMPEEVTSLDEVKVSWKMGIVNSKDYIRKIDEATSNSR